MVSIYLSADDLQKARSDLFEQDANKLLFPAKADALYHDAMQTTPDTAPMPTLPPQAGVSAAPPPTPSSPVPSSTGVGAAGSAPPTPGPSNDAVATVLRSMPSPSPPPAPTPTPTPTPAPASNGQPADQDVEGYIRQQAQANGVDPDTAVKVWSGEGRSSYAGDSNSSFGPFQLHYGNQASGGNAVGGLGDTFTQQTGLDARDPSTWKQQVDFALKQVAQGGWNPWHGAAAQGVGQWQGVGGQQGAAGALAAPAASAPTSGPASRTSQFALGLTPDQAYAACGPAAAIAFANTYGRNPTAQEAIQLAQKYGWTPQSGMAGIQSEQKLLNDGMGVPTTLEQTVDWGHVASSASNGSPVIVSTPGHYFYVTGYDQQSGKFNVGTSGTDLKGGSTWMSPDEMQAKEGATQGALYAANPQSGPTTMGANQPASSPQGALPQALGQAKDAIGGMFSGLGSAVNDKVQPAVAGALDPVLGAGIDSRGNGPLTGGLPNIPGAWAGAGNILDQNPDLGNMGRGPNPYRDIVQQGVPQIASGIQQGNAGDILSGGLNVVGGVGSALPGGGFSGMAPADLAQSIMGLAGKLGLRGADGVAADLVQNAAPAAQLALPRGATPMPGSVAPMDQLQVTQGTWPGGAPPPPSTGAFQSSEYFPGSLEPSGPWQPPAPRVQQPAFIANMLTHEPAVPPDMTAALPQQPFAANDVYHGGEPPVEPGQQFTRDPQGNIVSLQQPMTDVQLMQAMLDTAKMRPGADPSKIADMEGQLQGFLQSRQTAQAGVRFATTLGGAAAGGAGAYQTTDPNDPNRWLKVGGATLAGGVLGAATPDVFELARNGQLGDVFKAYHTGNVISGLGTLTHVAVNSIVAPAWSFATRGVADVLSGGLASGGQLGSGFSRVQGSGVGLAAGLAHAGEDLASSFMGALRDPNAVANQVGGVVGGGLKAQRLFTALHAAAQGAAQGVITKIELGRLAGDAASTQGLTGGQWTQAVAQMIDQPAADMLAQASGVAQRAVLRGDLGTLGSKMQDIASIPFAGNTLFPVVKISANALSQGIEKSPLGLLGTGVDVARKLAGSGPYAGAGGFAGNGIVTPLGERLTNNLAGTALTAWLAQKSMDGSITGNGPADPKERAYLTSQGWQPNSIYIPGRGYVDYRVLGPIALPLSIAGNYHDAVAFAKSGADPGQIAGDLAQRMASYMSNATGLQTIGELYNALQGGASAQGAAGQFVGQVASGFLPESSLMRGLVSSADPTMRQAKYGDVQQYLQEGLPGGTPGIGGRTDLPAKLDEMGQPLANPAAGLGVFSPRTGAGAPNAVLKVLGDAGMSPPAPPKQIMVGRVPVDLTPDDQQQFAQIRGQILTQMLQPLTSDKQFAGMPIDVRQRVLGHVMTVADEAARKQLLSGMNPTNLYNQMAGTQINAPQAYASPTPFYDENAGLGQQAAQPTLAQLRQQQMIQQAGLGLQLQNAGATPTPALLASYAQ